MHAKLIDKRSDFNTKYQYAYNIQDASNEEFSKHLKKLEEVVLPEYTEKIKDSRQKAYEQFRIEFLDKLKSNIDEVKKQIKELNIENRVIQTGALYGDDLYAWYYLADFFVLASYQEAFGAVVNEALAGGCFALVSDHAGAHTLIQNDVNGYVFKSGSKEDLKDKLISIFKRPKKTEHHSNMLKTFEEFYKDITCAFNK